MNLSDLPAAQQQAFIASLQSQQAAPTTTSFQPVPDPFATPSPKADPFATPSSSPKAAAQAAPQASMLPEPGEVASIATTISKTIGDVVTSVAAAARPRPAPVAPRPFAARPPVVRPASKAQASAQDLAASLAAAAEAKKAEEAKAASDRTWTYAAVGAGVVAFGAAVYALARK